MLPHKGYRLIDNDKIISDFILCRVVCKMVKKLDPATGKMKSIRLKTLSQRWGEINLRGGISTNLLSVFRKGDVFVRAGGKWRHPHHTPWQPGDMHMAPPYVKYDSNATFIGIKIKDIQNLKAISCTIKYEDKTSQNAKAFLKVVHMPTKCNFWHFEIQLWFMAERSDENETYSLERHNKISDSQKKKMIKEMSKMFTDELSNIFRRPDKCHPRYLSKKVYK